MRTIPAIVLTYDKNRPYSEHMMARYDRLWPSHPFVFHIPFQVNDRCQSSRTTMVPTPKGIRDTVLTLLKDRDERQWIYWCIDDKYPIWINSPMLKRVAALINSNAADNFDGVSTCRARALLDGRGLKTTRFGLYDTYIVPELGPLFRRNNYRQIWLHQFLRVGVLRTLFDAFPSEVTRAKDLDDVKDRVKLPEKHLLLVTRDSYIAFGESASRGIVTRNCRTSMKSMGLEPPSSECDPKPSIVIGDASCRARWASPSQFIRDALSVRFSAHTTLRNEYR